MKLIPITVLLLITSVACFAQKRNTYYLKDDGRYVTTRDSADYIRIIQEPDSGSTLYNVADLYKNGVQKLIGKSSKVLPVVFQGQVARFYPNGKKMQFANYHDNHLTGLSYQYYPNGKIFSVVEYRERMDGDKEDYWITTCLDTLGNMVVKDGNGHYSGFDGDGNGIIEEGEVRNGLREGDWKGSVTLIGIGFKEHYENGKLLSGVATDKSGNMYNYSQRDSRPYYSKGNKALGTFLINQVNYFGRNDVGNVNGTAVISFTIDERGKITNIRILNSASELMNEYLSEALASSAKGWVPAKLFGVPHKETFSFPYSLKTRDSEAFY